MHRYSGDPFDVEILSDESFIDGVYTINVIVIRLSLTAQTGSVMENWDYVFPILIGVGAAFAAAGVAGMV